MFLKNIGFRKSELVAKTQFTALMLERKINLEDIQDHKVVSVMSHKFNLLLLSSGA